MTDHLRRFTGAGVIGLGLAATLFAASPQRDNRNGRDSDPRRPKLTLKAQPTVAIAPGRIVCRPAHRHRNVRRLLLPTVAWIGATGPNQSPLRTASRPGGQDGNQRRFTVEHVFRAGGHQIVFRLKGTTRC
jgi:hypothetical protein